MIDNEAIQEELEAEQQPQEIDALEAAFMAALLLALTEVYVKYDNGSGINMTAGKRKKQLFARISEIVANHYFGVSQLVEGNAKAAFESTYERFMSAYEEELDLPIMEVLAAEVIQNAFDRGYPLPKTMAHNRNVTNRMIRRQLTEAFRQQEPLQLVSERVTEVVRSDRQRVETVVQEETARMQVEGQMQSVVVAEEQGIGVDITWHSLRDNRVRRTHQVLHGKKADKDGYFYSSGCKGKGPHLFEGPNAIKENIRCRCYLEARGVNVRDNALWRELNSAESSSARRELWENRRALARERQRGDIS